MVPASSPVMLPEHVVRAAEEQARLRGVSLDEWVSRAVAERLDTTVCAFLHALCVSALAFPSA